MTILTNSMMEKLSEIQNRSKSDKAFISERIFMSACPFGCGRACSGCEYSCQNTSSK